MSDLQRRREARQLWVSRSHLHAAVAFAALLALTSFGLGYLVGRTRTATASAPAPRHASLVEGVPGESLVDLLARIERARVVNPTGAVQYPDLLEKGAALDLPGDRAPEARSLSVRAPEAVAVPEADAPLSGARFAIRPTGTPSDPGAWARGLASTLRAAALDARAVYALVDGRPSWRVEVAEADGLDADGLRAAAGDPAVAVEILGAVVPEE